MRSSPVPNSEGAGNPPLGWKSSTGSRPHATLRSQITVLAIEFCKRFLRRRNLQESARVLEELHHVRMAILRGIHQRRFTMGILGVHIGVSVEQHMHHVRMTVC